MNIRFTYFAMMLIGFLTFAATTEAVAGEGERDSIPESAYESGYPNPFALGVHVGTTGVGLHIYQPLGNHFGLRLGGSFMPFHTDIVGNYSNRDVRSDVSAKANNVSLLVGWAPFSQQRGFFRSFNIQVGGAYFFDLSGKLESRLVEGYRYGDINVHPDRVGTITTNVNWKETVNPYAGIGWSNIVLDSRFSVSIDLGAYYLSKPTVTMEATGLLEENVNNAPTIENNIKNYRYLPRVEIGFSYRFWK
ncbi:hypothetical protein [Sphingobacterium bambusae]|uniref:Outer membrane protein beta-barrel domain-containing protein n=1 Tax=Sphingobacterium bambusae TaxID=662858 RepID=A0ABW6BB19_9SPHI|nr:hypothetical protein [Sphingobacterium bambusae]WPL46873.1 hypothetical protein SCB77_12970 [Sphingobacterium bambusae]